MKNEEKKKNNNNEVILDITWGELDNQIKQAQEAKKNKGRRRYI